MHEVKVTDTIDFHHHSITQPEVTPEDRLQHRLTSLTNALREAPNATNDLQLEVLAKLQDALGQWGGPEESKLAPRQAEPASSPDLPLDQQPRRSPRLAG